jgi:hypothetical protein
MQAKKASPQRGNSRVSVSRRVSSISGRRGTSWGAARRERSLGKNPDGQRSSSTSGGRVLNIRKTNASNALTADVAANSKQAHEPPEAVPENSTEVAQSDSPTDQFDNWLLEASLLTKEELTQLRQVFAYIASSTYESTDLSLRHTVSAAQARYTLTQMGFDVPTVHPRTRRLVIKGIGNFECLNVESFLQTAAACATETRERIQRSVTLRGPEKAAALFRLMDPGNKGKVNPEGLLHFLRVSSPSPNQKYTLKEAKRVCQAISRTHSDQSFNFEDLKGYMQNRRFALSYVKPKKAAGHMEPDIQPTTS